MNKHFKFIIAVFPIVGILFILCFMLKFSGTKENTVREKNRNQDTTIVLKSSGMEEDLILEKNVSQDTTIVLRSFGLNEITIREKNWTQDTTIVLENGIYKLELRTIVLDDTLEEEWKEYGFLAPLIRGQHLVFYKNGEKINEYEILIEKVIKKTQGGKKVSLVSIPVYDICLLKGSDIEVYKVYGSDFCNGMCPEFTGLYNMEGKMISEYIAVKKYFVGEDSFDFLTRNKIDINAPAKCNSILEIFTFE